MDQNRKIIYADELLNAIREDMTIRGAAFAAIMRHINAATAVDAVEMVHARWECVYDRSAGETDVTCSHCKDTRTIKGCYETANGEPCYFEDDYCPNCGAKMDGGGNG